jgi:ATP-dependent helicase/nuclease subunit A
MVLEMFEEPEAVPYVPAFLREERKGTGAERGTAYHRVMECIDLSKIRNSNEVKEQIAQLVVSGKLLQTAADTVNPYDIFCFHKSNLCKRIIQAQKEGKLYKEQPFVIAKPAIDVSKEYDSEKEILIQGIIDVYFEEEDGLVLLDYKTDKVFKAQELVDKYKAQLEYYAKALERLTGKKVKEKLIYSFALAEEIEVK